MMPVLEVKPVDHPKAPVAKYRLVIMDPPHGVHTITGDASMVAELGGLVRMLTKDQDIEFDPDNWQDVQNVLLPKLGYLRYVTKTKEE